VVETTLSTASGGIMPNLDPDLLDLLTAARAQGFSPMSLCRAAGLNKHTLRGVVWDSERISADGWNPTFRVQRAIEEVLAAGGIVTVRLPRSVAIGPVKRRTGPETDNVKRVLDDKQAAAIDPGLGRAVRHLDLLSLAHGRLAHGKVDFQLVSELAGGVPVHVVEWPGAADDARYVRFVPVRDHQRGRDLTGARFVEAPDRTLHACFAEDLGQVVSSGMPQLAIVDRRAREPGRRDTASRLIVRWMHPLIGPDGCPEVLVIGCRQIRRPQADRLRHMLAG
jgi:hypothetical protein